MVKVFFLLAFAGLGCSVPTLPEAPAEHATADAVPIVVVSAPELVGPAREAAAEWAAVTGIPFYVEELNEGSPTEGVWRVERGYAEGHVAVTDSFLDRAERTGQQDPNPRTARVEVNVQRAAYFGLDADEMRRVLLHEFGHALGLSFDSPNGDRWHYHGKDPSVMAPRVDETSLHVGAPELAAWDVASRFW